MYRIMPIIGWALRGWQCAYGRDRGAEMHLLELTDLLSEGVRRDGFVSVAILDVNVAFDAVPHHLLFEALRGVGVDCSFPRYVAIWLARRSFRARSLSPAGHHFSPSHRI